jgi:hypothetical protein
MESIGDLDVLNVQDSVRGVVKTFHVVSKAFIMLLFEGLQSFCHRWTLVRALKAADEHGT